MRGKPAAIRPIQTVAGVLRHGGRLFVQKRPPSGVWGGLWEFPGGRIEPGEDAPSAIVREFLEETGFAVRVTHGLGLIRHGYTTYRLRQHCFGLELESCLQTGKPPLPPCLTAATDARWVTMDELNWLAMPAAHRKLADLL